MGSAHDSKQPESHYKAMLCLPNDLILACWLLEARSQSFDQSLRSSLTKLPLAKPLDEGQLTILNLAPNDFCSKYPRQHCQNFRPMCAFSGSVRSLLEERQPKLLDSIRS